jgi:hypothetical protein
MSIFDFAVIQICAAAAGVNSITDQQRAEWAIEQAETLIDLMQQGQRKDE